MELIESIERINEQLIREFGRAFNGWTNFRVVFSDDQFEKRWTDKTDEGLQLIHPEVRELPKYRQYIQGLYILERFIPIVGESDLTENVSYEPAWVFRDKDGNYLPPRYDMCKFIIEVLFSQMKPGSGHAKYKDPHASKEEREKLILEMEHQLFGDETSISDALTYRTGVAGFNEKSKTSLEGEKTDG